MHHEHTATNFGDAVEAVRKLFEIAPEVTLVVDAEGRIVRANPRVDQLLGHTADELIDQPVEMLIPERLRSIHRDHRKLFSAAPRTRPMGVNRNIVAMRKSGEEFPTEIALAPMRVGSETFTVVSIRDITESRAVLEVTIKRARFNEQLARLSELALGTRHLDEWLAAIPAIVAEALGVEIVIVYLLDYGGTNLLCKAAHGLTASQVEVMHERADQSSQPGYVLTSGQVLVVDYYAVETRFRVNPLMLEMGMKSAIGIPLSDGKNYIGTLTARATEPRHFKDGEVDFMKAASNIVTATIKRLRTEEQLAHAQRIESLGKLTGGIAHDFNNLLTVISGNLQLIEDAAHEYPALSKPVASAMRATARGAGLTAKLLAFARQQTLSPRAIDLAQHLPQLQDMLTRTLGEQIEVRIAVPVKLAPCLADPGQLDNALINLALNARDAMPGGGRLTIEASETTFQDERKVEQKRAIVISVTDTGIGMTPEVKMRAFEPFFTTKETGKGSGLGLSMAHGFAKQSGGHVTLYSEPGGGATVRLYLPVADSMEPEETAVVPHGAIRRHARILVVEDDAEVRAVAVSFLSGLGYSMIEAHDASAALRALDGESGIDLLFSDIVLPGKIAGYDLARMAQSRLPGLKVLLTTGHAGGGLPPERASRLEYALLHKPYSREDLAAAIRAQLDRTIRP